MSDKDTITSEYEKEMNGKQHSEHRMDSMSQPSYSSE